MITGGTGGLGKVLTETYGMRGVSVAVLDSRAPEGEQTEAMENVRFYKCDVSDIEDVRRAKEAIEKDVRRYFVPLPNREKKKKYQEPDLPSQIRVHSKQEYLPSNTISSPSQQLGPPTILINNAGTVSGSSLLALTPSQINLTLQTNLHSHFHTLQTFLPSLLASPTGSTIVTISSVLGRLGAAHLTDYAAAKAGLIALHASLRAELSSPKAPAGAENVRMVLVTPGQLGTRLFADVQTPSPFLGPVVEAVELAGEIVRMVDSGCSGEVSLPLYARFIGVLEAMPFSLQRAARWASGVDRAMEGFRRKDE